MAISEAEKKILDSIIVRSENDPLNPEFPAGNPEFPATPTYKIDIPGFSNVWLKDESKNPTGTHKDRMAWEVVVTYRDFLLAKERDQVSKPLPQMSIISSGSAAVAIQVALAHYSLPNLKVLVDKTVSIQKIEALKKIGCEVYVIDLSKTELTSEAILRLTDNKDGFDITSAEALDPALRFYDWLSYEIINESPSWCFVPFGTGNLYENILNITKREVSTNTHDPRFHGEVDIVRNCNFIGATTNNPASKISEKLYSPHLPFVHFSKQWIDLYKRAGYCGQESDVFVVEEKYIDEALVFVRENKIMIEQSAVAGLALFFQMKQKVPLDAKIVIVSTGKTIYTQK